MQSLTDLGATRTRRIGRVRLQQSYRAIIFSFYSIACVMQLTVYYCAAVGQWAGLVKSCVALPELNNCSRLIDTAFAELESWLDREVYPDGMETEEAFGYDMWTARSFFNTIEILQQAKHPPPPQSYLDKVETMFEDGVYSGDQL